MPKPADVLSTHTASVLRTSLALVAVALVSSALTPVPSQAGSVDVDKDTRKCIAALNRQLGKLDVKVANQVHHCVKAHALGKTLDSDDPGITTVSDCIDGDRKAKIAKAADKARTVADRSCMGPPPAFAADDVEEVIDAGSSLGRGLARDLFGASLDALVTRDADAATSQCQRDTWKAVAKCTKKRLSEFFVCKKKGLARGTIASAADLEGLCLMQGGNPQTGQADPKGKIAKACSDAGKGIGKAVAKRCGPVTGDEAFPGCAAAPDLVACLDALAACRVCRAINAADGLTRNCDLFDDSSDNGSCGCGDGILTAAEECDDGNSIDDDECSNACTAPVGPTTSCLTILGDSPSAGDGMYQITLPSGPAPVYCDMTSAGGGWTRVGVLDGATTYCTNDGFTDLRAEPGASAGKIPDADVQALMSEVPGSPVEILFYVPADGRFIWRDLIGPLDFDTSSRHTSPAHYCSNWQCDGGGSSFTLCSSEGSGCPVTGHGGAGAIFRKIYVDYDADGLRGGLHTNGGLCGLPNYNGEPIWVFVR